MSESINPQFGYIIEYVSDMKASLQFYSDVMGLSVEREHPNYIQFDSFAIANDESLNGNAGSEIYWLVDDIEAAFNEFSQKAEVALPVTQKAFGKVFGIEAPDGTVRYLLEFAKERPSKEVDE